MAIYTTLVAHDDAEGTRRVPPDEYDVPASGATPPVPSAADDRANLAAGRIALKTAGPGPTPTPSFTPVVFDKSGVGKKLHRSDTNALIVDLESVGTSEALSGVLDADGDPTFTVKSSKFGVDTDGDFVFSPDGLTVGAGGCVALAVANIDVDGDFTLTRIGA